jgi:uroporphyrinogen-III synthase
VNRTNHQIIITRPQPHNSALHQKIQQAGLHSIQIPAIIIKPIQAPAWPGPEQIDIVIILSQFVISTANQHLKLYNQAKFYCVGPGTQKGLLDIGIQSNIPTTDYSTQGLLALSDLAAVEKKHILILTGSPMQQTFKTELCQKGAHVTQIATYHRIPLSNSITKKLSQLDPSVPTCFVTTSHACFDALKTALRKSPPLWQNSQIIVVGKKSQLPAKKIFSNVIIAKDANHDTLLSVIRPWYDALKDCHVNQMSDVKPKVKNKARSKHVVLLWLAVLMLTIGCALTTLWGYQLLMAQNHQLQQQNQSIKSLTNTLESSTKDHLIKWPEVQYALLQAKTNYLNNHQTQLSLQWLAAAQTIAQAISPIHLKPLIDQTKQLSQQLTKNPDQNNDIKQIINQLQNYLTEKDKQEPSTTPTNSIESWHDLDTWITTHWWNHKENLLSISPLDQLRIQQLIGLLRDSQAMLTIGNMVLWQEQIQAACQLADQINTPLTAKISDQLAKLPTQIQKDTDHFDQLLNLNQQLQSEHVS